MWARLFRSKSREISHPCERLWVKYFTADIPRRDLELSRYPKFAGLLAPLPYDHITPSMVNQNLDSPTTSYLVDLFELNTPPSRPLEALIRGLSPDTERVFDNTDVADAIAPLIFQFAIKYIRQFLDKLSSLAHGSDAEEFCSGYLAMNYVLQKLPHKYTADARLLTSPVFHALAGAVGRQLSLFSPAFVAFMSNLLHSAVPVRIENGHLSEDDASLFEFAVWYFNYMSRLIGDPSCAEEQLLDCFFVTSSLMQTGVEFATKYKRRVLDPFIVAGFNLLSFPATARRAFFEIGNAFLDSLRFAISVDANYIWQHTMLPFVLDFARRTIEANPFILYPETAIDSTCETELFRAEFEVSEAAFVFIEEATLSTVSVTGAPVEDLTNGQFSDTFSDVDGVAIIGDHRVIRTLFENILAMAKLEGSHKFVMTFVNRCLQF
jgi:hypothetical protein